MTRLVRHAAALVATVCLLAAPATASAADDARHTVAVTELADTKAVFATVESTNVVPARVRTGGTIAELVVDEGDRVERGAVIAIVGDDKVVLGIVALDAAIAGAQAQARQARIDLERADALAKRGTGTQARLDEARTALASAENAVKARTAERAVARQRLDEGRVLAPASGRVLSVPVTVGTVVAAGETIARIADEATVLRLRVPERHARSLKTGDPVVLETRADGVLGASRPGAGRIILIHPEIVDGRVVADAEATGIGDYFVGERIRVRIGTDRRMAIMVPADFLVTRFGVDLAMLETPLGVRAVPVQRARAPAAAITAVDGVPMVEVLTGLAPGDVLVRP